MNDLSRALHALRLTPDAGDLAAVRAALASRLREGAAADGQALAMLPAWLAPPSPGLAGEAVAIDAGGTNLRAARVEIGARGEPRVIGEVEEAPFPGSAGRPEATCDALFAAHAALVARLGAPRGCPIGYCFSYPTRVLPSGDAVLLRWTKEVRVHDVEHREVGALLRRHLAAAGLDPGPVMVLNDTIAALAAGSLGSGTSPSRTVGLIVGTGSNMGAYLPLSRITKVRAPGWPSPFMAVNFESGAFSPPGLGAADDEVDERSVNPGAQRFEKAVSGAYLGRIFSAAAPRLGITGVPLPIESAEVSRLAVDAKGTPEGMLARALLDRSADLVAAALAATADMLDGEGALAVVAEGSLIQRGPGHAARVEQTLGAMLGTRPILIFRKDANLIGSALAALSHAASAT